jgi:hypothetical protein
MLFQTFEIWQWAWIFWKKKILGDNDFLHNFRFVILNTTDNKVDFGTFLSSNSGSAGYELYDIGHII